LQIIANQLIQALAEGFGLRPGARNRLLVDGEGQIHIHIIRVHVIGVNKMNIDIHMQYMQA